MVVLKLLLILIIRLLRTKTEDDNRFLDNDMAGRSHYSSLFDKSQRRSEGNNKPVLTLV